MNREGLLRTLVSNLTVWPKGKHSAVGGHWDFIDDAYINSKYETITIDDWNRAKIVPNTKIRILSPEHSEYVQKLAFEAGITWYSGEVVINTAEPYLFFDTDNCIEYSDDFELFDDKEIFIELPATKDAKEILDETDKMLKESGADIMARALVDKLWPQHGHYFKDVSDLDEVDVYRVCDLFEVNDPSGAKQHAIKKLLCSGKRGAKDERKDLEEARDTIIRKLSMMTEDGE